MGFLFICYRILDSYWEWAIQSCLSETKDTCFESIVGRLFLNFLIFLQKLAKAVGVLFSTSHIQSNLNHFKSLYYKKNQTLKSQLLGGLVGFWQITLCESPSLLCHSLWQAYLVNTNCRLWKKRSRIRLLDSMCNRASSLTLFTRWTRRSMDLG